MFQAVDFRCRSKTFLRVQYLPKGDEVQLEVWGHGHLLAQTDPTSRKGMVEVLERFKATDETLKYREMENGTED